MGSLRASRHFEGTPISLRALAVLERRSSPLSLRAVISSDQVRQFSGQVTSGDVTCTWSFVTWQNGFWSASGKFHDGGTVAGDFFFVEFLLGASHGVGARLQGSILDVIQSRHLALAANGSDSWIRDNWDSIESGGLIVRLHAAPALGELVVTPIAILAVVPFAVYVVAAAVVIGGFVAINVAAGRTLVAQRCDDSMASPDQPAGAGGSGSQPACVQFKFVDPGTQ